jgi:hypothetical protein
MDQQQQSYGFAKEEDARKRLENSPLAYFLLQQEAKKLESQPDANTNN